MISMLHLVVFTFLQGAVHVAMGAGPTFPILSSVNGGSKVYPDLVARPPINTDIVSTTENVSFWLSKPSELSLPEYSSQTCTKRPAILTYFADDFIERMMACRDLQKAYQVRQFNTKSLASFFYEYVYKKHLSVNAPDAPVSARIVADAVAANNYKVKEDSVLRIFAYATASILFYRGALNTSNVGALSLEYFTRSVRSIKSVVSPTPEANLSAVCKAFVDFLSAQGLYNPQGTVLIAALFASQWYDL